MVRGDVGEERERWAAWAGIISFWLLAPLAVVGARFTRRRDRTILLIPVMIALVTTVVIYGGHRIRAAAEPAIVILAAVAIDRWPSRHDQLSESVPN
jgi:asparagine N-glycosylation enzyme membrane subunit Stt3